MPKPSRQARARVKDTESEGFFRASVSGQGVASQEFVRDYLEEYHRLNTPEARAAFALHWVDIAAKRLDHTWPTLYELLALIRDQELFRKQGFERFEAYLKDRLGLTWETFVELERVHHFAHTCAPELKLRRYADARAVVELAIAAVKTDPLPEQGQIGNGRSRNNNVISTIQGNSQNYLTARIARDHPEILDRMKAGEFGSVRAAALVAGIVKPVYTIPHDIPRAARLLLKHFSAAEIAELVRLLVTQEEVRDGT